MSEPNMRDPLTSDYFEVFEVKHVKGPSTSRIPEASPSRAILGENRRIGSENPPNIATVYAELQKQGERTDNLIQNQTKALEHFGTSTKEQWAALAVQGNTLKQQGDTLDTHSQAILKLLQDQQKMREDVDFVGKEVGRQGLILKQQETTLKVIEGRVDKLFEGHVDKLYEDPRGNGNLGGNSKLRRSTRLEASRIQKAPASGRQVKYQQVECNYCGKTLSSSYIRHHVPKCPVFRQGQDKSQ